MVRLGNLAAGVLLTSGMIAMGLPARSQDSGAPSVSCQGPLSMPEVQEEGRKLTHLPLIEARHSGMDSDQLFQRFKFNLNAGLRLSRGIPVEAKQAAQEMTLNDARACFPALMPAFKIGDERKAARLEAEKDAQVRREAEQRQIEAEQQTRKREEEDRLNKRVGLKKLIPELDQEYSEYIVVKRCHEAREGYAAIHIFDPEMARAKNAIQRLESVIKLSEMDLDALWSKANEIANGRFPPGQAINSTLCKRNLR